MEFLLERPKNSKINSRLLHDLKECYLATHQFIYNDNKITSLWVVVGRPFPAAAAQEVLVCGGWTGPEAATGGLIATDIGMGIGAAIGLATGTGAEVSSEI